MTTEDPSPTERTWAPNASAAPPPPPADPASEPTRPAPEPTEPPPLEPSPADPKPSSSSEWREPAWAPPRDRGHNMPAIVFGIILIVIGLWFFARTTLQLDIPAIEWDKLWPLLLIGLGLWVLYGARNRRDRRDRR